MNKHDGGFVYVQTNDADDNEVVVFARGADGELERRGSHLTGGKGSGEPHLPSQSSVVLADGRLFVTNAGSNDVTLFRIDGESLVALDRVPSGGSTPRFRSSGCALQFGQVLAQKAEDFGRGGLAVKR